MGRRNNRNPSLLSEGGDVPEDGGFTTKELLLRLDAKLDTYIFTHSSLHQEHLLPKTTLLQEFKDVDKEFAKITRIVESHERTIQRIIGAIVLLSAIGFGTLVLLFLRISGVVPT